MKNRALISAALAIRLRDVRAERALLGPVMPGDTADLIDQPADAPEDVLTRLMTKDRMHIEWPAGRTSVPDEIYIRLNAIAAHAASSDDLRFLDALNYYYELLSSDGSDGARRASFLTLYERALNRWL